MMFDTPAAADLPIEESEYQPTIRAAVSRALSAWAPRPPMNLETWSRKHFYLSAESSYVEQQWSPWPFQRALMNVLSNDDVVQVTFKKSARLGYTKILLAFLLYSAHQLRRNSCIWQPTDDDRDEFVKDEVETALRDVKAMRDVMPKFHQRSKNNTLKGKSFLGSKLRTMGGKASGNYRRFSVDNAVLDELSKFDSNVEKEGSPTVLAWKRTEGATFPKRVSGSTPKIKGFCLIDEEHRCADVRMAYQIPCPSCGEWHAITWGTKDSPHGMKWRNGDATTVTHVCPHNGCSITQGDYLAVAEQGRYVSEDGELWLHHDGTFTDRQGNTQPAPPHVALHAWTALSPSVAWSAIVKEFLEAHRQLLEGDATKMQAFVNTTLGECWEGDIERTDASELRARCEPFPLRMMPRDCLLLLAGADTQDNRIEVGVWGYGRGGQMWTIDHRVFFGSPALPAVWQEVEEFLRVTQYPHISGFPQRIHATAIDSGGHHADAVYAFAHRCRSLNVHAIKGYNGRERSIEMGNVRVEYKWNGRIEKHGPMLWHVGTNLAKDRFQSRLEVTTPGPGYVHISEEVSDEWLKQLAGEVRATRRMQHGTETRWTPIRTRIEVKDCLAYAIWTEERLSLWHPSKAKFWDQLEQAVQPEGDLFAAAALQLVAPVAVLPSRPAPDAAPEEAPKLQAVGALREIVHRIQTHPAEPAPAESLQAWREVTAGKPEHLTLLATIVAQLDGPEMPLGALLDAALVANAKALIEPPAPPAKPAAPAAPRSPKPAAPKFGRTW
jgi:phage terminase large subunit GpA-like protein